MDYEKILSQTVVSLPPSGIRKFFDIAGTMQGVISLGVGEPDFPTPWEIRNAGIRSLENGKTRYTANRGLEALCREIATYQKRKYDLSYDPKTEVMVTVGGSEGIDAAIRAMVTPGDEVIIPQPSYVCYEPLVRLVGGIPVILETTAEHDFKVTPEMLSGALTERTKLLILPYPCNPTGAIMEKADLEALAAVLKDTNVVVLSDEIYAELTFGGLSHTSIASIDGMKERTVVVNGFSKTFSMTGWRLGYACAPEPILRQMVKIHQYAIMCAPTTAQYAAIEALRNGDDAVAAMKEEYDMRRRLIVKGFNEIGLPCRTPRGAFYAFPCIKSTGMTSEEFCEKLLYSQKVAVVPGTAFGKGGEGFIRASYCYSTEHISEALRRISIFLRDLKNS
ncbi:MAG: aminotransferase class I/II-fold pyridoxal phosphate-dependent enzyme [Ruminococcaceae bacterium]|nr:aminotransferase class I/II-fold pyridoxal phosphate-dependent enzyme [Oscillospiraceae bacterium]